MKLATYRCEGLPRLAVAVAGDTCLFDIQRAATRHGAPDAAFSSMLALIDAGPAALDRMRRLVEQEGGDTSLGVAVADAEFLAPVPVPRQMRDGMSFPLHILQAPMGMQRLAARLRGDEKAAAEVKPLPELPAVYRQRPIYYITNRFSVVGHGATVRWPRYSKIMDFELEFGIFIGRTGANVPASKAREHIFGYTIYNDFSARDAQMLEMPGMLGPAKGKSFDSGNALGPWLVTTDEIADPYQLAMSARVNGETWARGHSSGMLYSFEEQIAYITRDETLHAGEFIGSGTMGGGSWLELGRFLESGDTVELEVEGLGVLSNKVMRQE